MIASANEQLDRARGVIAELRKRIASLQAASAEPIAVVGMACRFPGEARDCEGYWRMIAAGGNAVGFAPAQRARDLGIGAARPAAFLQDIESFDAGFFEISPREAARMDPQQRLFLEVAWEALEDAGQTRAALAGSLTGVFVGVLNLSNGYMELQTSGEGNFNEYSATGAGHDVIAGRLAYLFDLRGPNVAINTACSSSLVAVHLACQSLLTRESRVAVAGGVNLILGPKLGQLAHISAMLAPDGRCKTFDSRADGYGRGEGCGVVVLKRLSDALADRDRILAVIRGSATNQDGRTNGLTAPNGLAQQDLMRRALQRAGIDPARVGYVETHGTGTALGDPIEVEALAEVYGHPAEGAGKCFLGAAKANINHLEGAAGVAGLIKAILALRARRIPPVAGLDELNPHFSLQGSRLSIPAAPVEWQSELPRVAGVSAFGWSGVNCHVVVEEAPAEPPVVTKRPTMLVVSASDQTELSARANAFADALATLSDDSLESFAWTATVRRTHYESRLAVAGATGSELAQGLRRAAAERERTRPAKSQVTVGWVIGDDLGSVNELGRELWTQDPVFQGAVEVCAAAFAAAGQSNVAADLRRGFGLEEGLEGRLEIARVLSFAAGVGAMLNSWGVKPTTVAGFGAGTLAAKLLNGEFQLTQIVRLLAQGQQVAVDRASAMIRLKRSNVTHVLRLDGLSQEGRAAAPNEPARLRLMRFSADLATNGAELAFAAIYAPEVRVTALPAHPFRRRRHWITEAAPAASAMSVPPVPSDWFFETRWHEAPAVTTTAQRASAGAWLILGESDGPAQLLSAALHRVGGGCSAEIASGFDFDELCELVSRGWARIVDLRPLDRRAGPLAAQTRKLAGQLVELSRALERVAADVDTRVWLATRGAQDVLPAERPDLPAASLWGLVRSLILDQPARWGGVIDLDPGAVDDAEMLRAQINASAEGPEEVAFRGGDRYVYRLSRVASPPVDSLRLEPNATYLVTGAFGVIGPLLAVWLARRGATSLVLSGRSIADVSNAHHPKAAVLRQLQELGVDVVVERCDIGDRASVTALFDRIRRIDKPLRGIFHAAADAAAPVAAIQDCDLEAAFRSKVDGTLLLDECSRAFDLDLFVLFSSAAAVLGARGQGHYSAANAFMDSLAAARRAASLPGLSIAWGLWDREAAAQLAYFRRVGLSPMDPQTALQAMASIASATGQQPNSRPVVVALDGDRLRAALALRGRAAFLSQLAPVASSSERAADTELTNRLRHAQPVLRETLVSDAIAAQVRVVMELAPGDSLNSERGFFDLGMDSMMTVTLKQRLEELFGVGLPSTLAMDYPSVAALTRYFLVLLGFSVATVAARTIQLPAVEKRAPDELADDEVGAALAAELQALESELPA